MAKFEEYANKYQTVQMERREGVLQLTLKKNRSSPFYQTARVGPSLRLIPRPSIVLLPNRRGQEPIQVRSLMLKGLQTLAVLGGRESLQRKRRFTSRFVAD